MNISRSGIVTSHKISPLYNFRLILSMISKSIWTMRSLMWSLHTFDYLGVRISNILSWEQHVSRICQRLYSKHGLLNRMSSFLPFVVLLRIYKQTIVPILVQLFNWHECGTRIILQQSRRKCSQEMRSELKLLTLHSRRRFLRFMYYLKHEQQCFIRYKDTRRSQVSLGLIKHALRMF